MNSGDKSPYTKFEFFLFPNCSQETCSERLHLRIPEQQLTFNPEMLVAHALPHCEGAILSLFANVDE